MRLSQNIIYYQLSRSFQVQYATNAYSEIKYQRPIFYDAKNDITNYVVIIEHSDLVRLIDSNNNFTNTLFICQYSNNINAKSFKSPILIVESNFSKDKIFNCLQRIFIDFDNWDEKLKTVVNEEKKFSDLVDCCDSVIYDPFSIVDKEFHYLAYSKLSEEAGLVDVFVDSNNNIPLDIVREIISDPTVIESNQYIAAYILYSQSNERIGVCKNIFYHEEYVGKICLLNDSIDEHFLKYYIDILEHLYLYTQRLFEIYVTHKTKRGYFSNLRKMLLDCMSKKNIHPDYIKKTFFEVGWNQDDRLVLVQFNANPRHDKNMYAHYLSIEMEKQWQGCSSIEYLDRLLLLVNLDKVYYSSKYSFQQEMAYFLRDNLLIAGMSRVFYNITQLPYAYEQTEIALEYGTKHSPTYWYHKFDDYALNYMMNQTTSFLDKEHICSVKLLELKSHDEKKQTEYYNTLRTYFYNKFNASQTAKQLFIQRSSFLYRLDRIQELVNIDFESQDELLYLTISFYILEHTENT